jgi:mRNA-degrading endonuclease RelE of RelBE toxin-antitoxin system
MFGQILMFLLTAIVRNIVNHPEEFFKLSAKLSEEAVEIVPHVRKFFERNNEVLGSLAKKYEKSLKSLSEQYVEFLENQFEELEDRARTVQKNVSITMTDTFKWGTREVITTIDSSTTTTTTTIDGNVGQFAGRDASSHGEIHLNQKHDDV